MYLKDLYAVVVTDKHVECRDFYSRHFGFEVLFEATWFVYLEAKGEHPYGVAFMSPDHPSEPPGSDRFTGRGLFLTFQVDDAALEIERLRAAGVEIAYELRDEIWGQRRFAVIDPAGMWIDVVEQIEAEEGFWERYAAG